MTYTNGEINTIRAHVSALEAQILSLKEELAFIDHGSDTLSENGQAGPNHQTHVSCASSMPATNRKWPLALGEYKRYGRQMIMPEIGLQGQLNLKGASVLIIGMGGLGCPAAAYLAGAGVGTIGLVDGDTVELSNLHRQILHTTQRIGTPKVDSAIAQLRLSNPSIAYIAHRENLTPTNALEILRPYQLILDCTDHPTSRYLISDAAVLTGKVLVSASALRTEGQLMVLNGPSLKDGALTGPCYRCVFPNPPPAESVVSCGDGGILGPVVGVMGVLMALEAIKIIAAGREKMSARDPLIDDQPRMMLFSAYGMPPFRSVRLRGKRPGCAACSSMPTITTESFNSGSLDYATFCGISMPANILTEEERLSPQVLERYMQDQQRRPVLLDVREKVQFDICHLDGSINIPYSTVEQLQLPGNACETNPNQTLDHNPAATIPRLPATLLDLPSGQSISVVCRYGNDSQLAVKKFKDLGLDEKGKRWLGDLKGGLYAWKRDVDPEWPDY